MKNLLQITYWTIGGFEGQKTIRQALQDARACGFGGLELAFGAGALDTDITPEACRQIRTDAQELGMALATMVSGFYWNCPLSSVDSAQRQAALEFTRKYIQVAPLAGYQDHPGHSGSGRCRLESGDSRDPLSTGLGQCHGIPPRVAAFRRGS